MLEVRAIRFTHPAGATIRADFSVPTGGSAALMGASGAGKSTILDLIAGFLTPHHGDIRFHQQSLLATRPADRPLTYLFQAHNLFPHLSVRQNLAIGIHPGLRLTAQQHAAIDRALAWVSLTAVADRNPDTLSGGQQQRVALARCLVRRRPLLLLDEPFTGVDPTLRAELVSLILSLQKTHNLTLLLTTHHPPDAEALHAQIVPV